MDCGLGPGYGFYPKDGDLGEHHSIVRWQAPEILAASPAVQGSKEADIFAFGMVVVEVFTAEVPFHPHSDQQVFHMIESGEIPKLSGDTEVVNGMRKLLKRCLKFSPQDRPNIKEVVKELQALGKLSAVDKLEVSARSVTK